MRTFSTEKQGNIRISLSATTLLCDSWLHCDIWSGFKFDLVGA